MAKTETFKKYLHRDCYIYHEYNRITHFWSGKVEYSHRLWMYNQPYPIPKIIDPQCDVNNWTGFFEFLNRKWIYSPSSYRRALKDNKELFDIINGFKFHGSSFTGDYISLQTRKDYNNYRKGDIVIVTLREKDRNSWNSDWELSLFIHGQDEIKKTIYSHCDGCLIADLIAMGFTYNFFKQRYETDFYLVIDESIIDIAVKCNDIKE